MITYKTIEVVNVRHEECTHYCGRPSYWDGQNGKDCTALGNPYGLADFDRDTSIQLYDEHFHEILATVPGALDAITLINNDSETMDIKLGCWCKPKSCRCDIIRKHFLKAWTQ